MENFVGVVDTELYRSGDWRDEANCRDVDPGIFFPVGESDVATEQTKAAVAICAVCMVQLECLQYALEMNQRCGIWGGYPEKDRKRLRKRWLAERRQGSTP